MADVSNQIRLAKSPYIAKGGKALPKRVDDLMKLSKSDPLVLMDHVVELTGGNDEGLRPRFVVGRHRAAGSDRRHGGSPGQLSRGSAW